MNADVLSRVLPPLPDRMTKDDWQEVADVLDAAAEWDAGRMPLDAFQALGTMARPAGGIPSSAYTRHVAARVTRPEDPRWRSLMRALDALADFAGFIRTQNGMFAPADIFEIPLKYRKAA